MTNKLKYFIGNWKMFGDFSSFKIINTINNYCYSSRKLLKKRKVVLCVPNTLIHFYKKKLKFKFISLGAQNCHHNDTYGPFTGYVNAKMLKHVGSDYVILGHSENRITGDTNKLIKKKIESSFKEKLHVIFCIGETMKEKKLGKTFKVLKKQLLESLSKSQNLNKLIIAYEPVWSIGTNKVPNVISLKKTINFIKNEYKKSLKKQKKPIVLYGGSVNDKNIGIFSKVSEIDGFLIGGASQSSKKFIDIIKNYYK